MRHEFITTHHSVPTKSDQFKRMKELEDNIIRKKDSLERESPGEKEIAKIKRRLKRVCIKMQLAFNFPFQ